MSSIPDGIWRCERCHHEWSHPPAQTECPKCGYIERLTWLNWPEVESAILVKNGEWPGRRTGRMTPALHNRRPT